MPALHLNNLISNVETKKRISFMKQWRTLSKNQNFTSNKWKEFITEAKKSEKKVLERYSQIPKINYPNLPVVQHLNEIKKTIATHQITIIAGDTGSGKSTQLPKICLDMGLGSKGLIGHTQPRRLAARAIAKRLSEETKTSLGEKIGFKMRFSDQTSENTLIKVMTDGILLAEIKHDRYLSKYEVIIIDEAHERSLNIDFLLGHIYQIIKKRPDLKLIITSATIDQEKFAKYFNAPIIKISGKTFPVEIRYQDPLQFKEQQLSQTEQILHAIQSLNEEKIGDILVFLATEYDIHETAIVLRKAQLKHTEILTLFSRLSDSKQNEIFNTSCATGRRIILSTNIAETSLTIPNIMYVIDAGYARLNRYSYRTKVQHLPIEEISQSSANQRTGRCGRSSKGICIRLYTEENFLLRPKFTDPEILRTNLASVILQMETLSLGEINNFPFLNKPDPRMIKDGYRLLYEIGALTEYKKNYFKITSIGEKIANFPLDPRLARILVSGMEFNVFSDILIIVSFLSIQDPRERPIKFQQKSEEAHKKDYNKNSDFIGIINLWNRLHDDTKKLSKKSKYEYYKKNFLSSLRIKEWNEIYHQLLHLVKNLKWNVCKSEFNYEKIHKALLSGFLGHVGFNHEYKEYIGVRGIKFHIFPGSSQFKRTPKWTCSAILSETTKIYARIVGEIDPHWLEYIAKHLTKHHYSDPFWSKKRHAVMSRLRITLYGLNIITNRTIQYDVIDPKISREIFIRHALIYGEFSTKADFFQKNLDLLNEIENLEHKSRRKNIVISEDTLFEYYDKLIPPHVNSGIKFEKWYDFLDNKKKQVLFFNKKSLMQYDANEITKDKYPEFLDFNGFKLPLSYRFDLTSIEDGVTITIPIILLDKINNAICDWLVPGFLEEKITTLIRVLPKKIRKACLPISHYVKAALESIVDFYPYQNFYSILSKQLTRITGIAIDSSIWENVKISQHLLMNYKIVDKHNKILMQGRDLNTIRKKLHNMNLSYQELNVTNKQEITHCYRSWDFDDIALSKNIKEHGISFTVYPCIEENKEGIILTHKPTYSDAAVATKIATRKLLIIKSSSIHQKLTKETNNKKTLTLLFILLKDKTWKEQLVAKSYDIAFNIEASPIVRSKIQFQEMYKNGCSDLIKEFSNLCHLIEKIMSSYQILYKTLNNKKLPLDLLPLYQKIKSTANSLVYKNFIMDTQHKWLKRIPLYLQALINCLEKAPRSVRKYQQYQIDQATLNQALQQKLQQKKENTNHDKVEEIRWLIYEMWITWYSQEIKTVERISVKRVLEKIKNV